MSDYLKIILSSEINEYQRLLSNVIESNTIYIAEKIEVTSINKEKNYSVIYFEDLNFWICTEKIKKDDKPRYFWNPCGTGKPQKNDKLQQVVQIGIDCKTESKKAGAFVKDKRGKVYLAHTGTIHGGNILKDYQNNNDVRVVGKKKMIIIGCLTDADFIARLAKFVINIKELKKS